MKNQLKTLLLLGVLTSILVGAAALVGPGWAYLALGVSLLLNVGAYFFSDRIVLSMNRAQPVDPQQAPELYGLVAELAQRAELPMPRVYLIDDQQPNAFATGRNPQHGVVAVTTGILGMLSTRELRGVIAHELAHIKNRDILLSSIAAVVASAVAWVGQALSFSAFTSDDDDGPGAGGLLFALLAPVAATLVQLGISRSREYLADETGARIADDPEALASALAKLDHAAHRVASEAAPASASLYIVNPFAGMESAAQLFSTHPLTRERVRRLLALRSAGNTPRRLAWAGVDG